MFFALLATQSFPRQAVASGSTSVGIIGSNSSAAIKQYLEANGFTVSDHGGTPPSRAVMDQHQKIILLRAAGNTDLSAWVQAGGVLITEWSASEWALNTASLISAQDAGGGSRGTGTAVTFTPSPLGVAVRGALPNPYSDAGATEFFRDFTGIGPGVEILATRPTDIPAIIGGASGSGYTFVIGYDWADGFTSGSDTARLLLNVLNAPTTVVVTSTSVSGITMTSADVTATVTYSESSVTARGFVFATTDAPTLGGAGVTAVASGTGTGEMSATITDLTRNTTYYVRAYATNTAGTSYGATQVFATAPNSIATTAGSVRWYEGPTAIDDALTVAGEPLEGATVSIDDNRPGDLLGCPDPAVAGISCAYNGTTGVLTLNGSASASDYQTALRRVTFSATNVSTVTTSRSITFNLGGALTFDPATGHYYEIVTVSSGGATYTGGAQDPNLTRGDLNSGAGISWEEARCRAKYTNARFGGTLMEGTVRVAGRTTQAADGCVAISGGGPLIARSINGQLGHLANITSLAEHQFLRTKLTGTGWIGGSDVDTEGTWVWMDGPEAGQVFWIQGTTNTRRGTNTIGGVERFNYWSDGEPNDASGEHWAEFGFGTAGVGSSWNDCRNGCGVARTRYVVEYSATGGVVPPLLSATRTVSPLPAQTITFAPPSGLVYGAPDLALVASSSSGRAVTLTITSGAGTTCALAGTTLNWIGPGDCVIEATQDGEDVPGGVQPAPPITRTIAMQRRALTITGLIATPRTYDGTTTVAVTGTPSFATADLVPGDVGDVSVGGTLSATLPSSAAGVGRSPTVVGLVLTGDRAFAYEPAATLSVDIARREVRIGGSFTVTDRPYDGTTAVSASSSALTLRAGDVLPGDTASLALGAVTLTADSAAAGPRTATPTAATLTGARTNDYVIVLDDAPTAPFTITAVPLTVASGTFTATDKIYDGTPVATVVAHDLVLTGFLAGDTMADITWSPAGRFASNAVGTGRTVTLLGGAVLGGPKGGGYTLDVTGAPTATASITPRPVTVIGASAAARPYDGTTAVTITGASLANVVAGDTITLANATSGTAASRDAGTQAVSTSMTLSGTAASNYRLVGQPSLSVTITPLPVSVTMSTLPARAYDGTSAVALTTGAFSVSGVLPGESIGVSGTAQLSSRSPGTRTVTLGAPTFTPGAGTNLANYTLPSSVAGSVTVTPLTLRIAGATVTERTWDGTTVATVAGARLDGLRAGDNVSLTGATSGVFASSQPGTHPVRFARRSPGSTRSTTRWSSPS
jgi:hypothetical protein